MVIQLQQLRLVAGTAATDAAAPVSTSDNITATKATAAKVATEKAAYYDRRRQQNRRKRS